jgi:hypothetical protein
MPNEPIAYFYTHLIGSFRAREQLLSNVGSVIFLGNLSVIRSILHGSHEHSSSSVEVLETFWKIGPTLYGRVCFDNPVSPEMKRELS